MLKVDTVHFSCKQTQHITDGKGGHSTLYLAGRHITDDKGGTSTLSLAGRYVHH